MVEIPSPGGEAIPESELRRLYSNHPSSTRKKPLRLHNVIKIRNDG